MIPRVATIIPMLLVWAGSISAQDATGHIEGRVLTGDTEPAAFVRVAATGPNLQLSRVAETDLRGYFRLQDLPVGSYQVRLVLVGYRPVRFHSVVVRLGRTTSVGVATLDAQALELGEIVVNARRPLIDVSSAADVTNLPFEQFRNLPTDRNFRSIVTLAPQANPSQFPGEEANIAGSSGPESAYYQDGVNITHPRYGGTNSRLPYNFVRELHVKAGGYEAEYGRATGGIVDVITHSGGNQFGGEVFGFFTNSGLTAEPRLALEDADESDFSEYDLGGSLGGPILRDRIWFFAAYDPNFRRQRLNVGGVALPDDRTSEHVFATKLTWQVGPRTDVVVSTQGDPSRRRGLELGRALDREAGPVAMVERYGGFVLAALVRQRLGGIAQAELGAARITRDYELEDASGRTDPRFEDFTTGVVSGGLGRRARDDAARIGVRGNIAAALGQHSVKIGIEYEFNRVDQFEDWSAEPGSPMGSIHRTSSTSYSWVQQRFGGLVQNRILTAYGQDSWRVGDRLTVNYGLRWDAQYLIGPDGKLVQRFTDLWQPRLGFIYQVGTPGTQKFFGSYGRFYEQFPLQLATFLYNPFRYIELEYDHDPRIDPSGADTSENVTVLASELPHPKADLRGQGLDEFTVGYERVLDRQFRIGVRGIYRTLRWAVEDALNPATRAYELGNPGRGNLAFTPRAQRTYRALVVTFEKPDGRRFSFLTSYVVSRSRGNYDGLSVEGAANPNITPAFDFPEPHATGLLYNDKPHALRFSGSYQFDFGLTAGTAIAWMSGEPRNELRQNASGAIVLMRPRGSAGRTDAVLDASVRLTYELPPWGRGALRPRVYLDVFRLGNRRTVLDFQELRYLDEDQDGNPADPNPNYGTPLLFQPPMSARIGLSVEFGNLD
jgi:hypothetical protein